MIAGPDILFESLGYFADASDRSCSGRKMRTVSIPCSYLLCVIPYCKVLGQLLAMIHQRCIDKDPRNVELLEVLEPVVSE
jgi:hypothetical protein